MKKIVKQHELIPPFYGAAYCDYCRAEWICYPIGVNLIVMLWRDFVGWWKNPKGRWV